jgi:ubiquinone/menaquinone biosynthesis C-methylase UbiE
MGLQLNLMDRYPRTNNRLQERTAISDLDREIARKFDFDYFDGLRQYGYGGYYYDPKYWKETVELFTKHYKLKSNARILDIGCAKGFMLRDFYEKLPNAFLCGVDISEYAIRNSDSLIKHCLVNGNAISLPFLDNSFDLVISINTLHNLQINDCITALKEIERVSRGCSFVMVDGWKTYEEKDLLEKWVLTARTILSESEWVKLFKKAEYTGDFQFWKV